MSVSLLHFQRCKRVNIPDIGKQALSGHSLYSKLSIKTFDGTGR